MKIVLLDGHTINPGDLSWSSLEAFGDLTVYPRTDASDVLDRIKDSEIILTSKVNFSKDIIALSPNLKMICVLATGYNNVDVEFAREKGILVTNIPAYSSQIVAQHTMALLLRLTTLRSPSVDLNGKSLGIIGYGNISKTIIPMATSFGMKILILSKFPDTNFAENVKFTTLEDVLSTSDFLSLHCPLTDENKGFINSETIAQMKRGIFIINTSRGGLINSKDLAYHIKSGTVGGAALDVLEHEPPVDGNPLIGLNNVFITPHIAWSGKETRAGLISVATKNIKSFLEGKPLNSVI